MPTDATEARTGAVAWHDIGAVESFGAEPKQVRVGRRMMVVVSRGGRLLAFDALCPHRKGPMRKAEFESDTIIACPVHAWRFDLADCGRELHGYDCLDVFDIRIRADRAEVALST